MLVEEALATPREHDEFSASRGERYILTCHGFSLPAEMPVQSAIFISPGTKRLHVFLISHNGNNWGIAMPTPKEYRLRADECLELMDQANLWYVKTALLKLATEFQKAS
jgi:hypothetical protein